ncbi:hypothetical protein MNV49_002385 [Pseudohyphozyma bogoriensis]|nr:hypothetical protein MNV49_002385 [Pseudohyphozyma bogoriensis]
MTYQLFSQSRLQCVQPVIIGLVGALVQSWFCRRSSLLFVKRRNGKIYAALGGSGVPGDYVNTLYTVAQATWLFSSALVTVINSGTLCYLLKKRVQGFNEDTANVLNTTIKLALETGSYTAIVATLGALLSVSVNLGSYYTASINFVFWVYATLLLLPLHGHFVDSYSWFNRPLSSFYTLSLFSTLDSRDQLARTIATNQPRHVAFAHVPGAHPHKRVDLYPHGNARTFGQVTVDIEVHEEEPARSA